MTALVVYELTWAVEGSDETNVETIHASSYWADETEDGQVLRFWDVDSPNAGRNPDPDRPLDTPVRVVEADEHEYLLGIRIIAAPDAPSDPEDVVLAQMEAHVQELLDRQPQESDEEPSNVAHVVLEDPEPDEG